MINEKNHKNVPPPPLRLAVSFSSSFTINKKSLSRLFLWLRLLPFVWTSASFFVPLLPFSFFASLRRLARLGRAGIVGKEAGRKWRRWTWGKGRRWLVQRLAGWVIREIGWEWRYLIPSYYFLSASPSACLQSIYVHSFREPLPISYLGCVRSPRKRG